MEKESDRPVGRKARRLRITVLGEFTQPLVEPLGEVSVESTAGGSVLSLEVVDQAQLHAVFTWLFARGIEIVSVIPGPVCDDSQTGDYQPKQDVLESIARTNQHPAV